MLLAALSLGVFFHTLGQGRDLETACTMVVNMLVVAEIFYLFNVRYLHMRSLTWRGAVGTPAVLGAIAVVAIDRKSVVEGKSVSVRVDLGGRRIIKKKKNR